MDCADERIQDEETAKNDNTRGRSFRDDVVSDFFRYLYRSELSGTKPPISRRIRPDNKPLSLMHLRKKMNFIIRYGGLDREFWLLCGSV